MRKSQTSIGLDKHGFRIRETTHHNMKRCSGEVEEPIGLV